MRLNEVKDVFDTEVLEEMLMESFFQYADQVAILNEDTGLYEFDLSSLKKVFQKGKEYVSKAKEGVDNASRKLWIQAQDKFSRAGGNNQIVQAVLNHIKKYGKGYLAGAAVLSVLAGMPDASAADVDSLFAEMDRSPTGFTTLDIESPSGVGAEKAFQMADQAHQQAHGGAAPGAPAGGATSGGVGASAGGDTVWHGAPKSEIADFFLHRLNKNAPMNITGNEVYDGNTTVRDVIEWKIGKDFQAGKDIEQTYRDIANDKHLKISLMRHNDPELNKQLGSRTSY